MDTRGYVYFIHEIGNLSCFKIGSSLHPEKRIKALNTGNKRKLLIYKTIECKAVERNTLERNIHIEFANSRINNGGGTEWFNIDKNTIDDIYKKYQNIDHFEKSGTPYNILENVTTRYKFIYSNFYFNILNLVEKIKTIY